MKNYNDIYDMKQEMCTMMDTAYSKGYDKAYNDRKIEEEFDEDRAKAIEEAYQKGLYDAWECAQKIWNMISPVRDKIFDTENLGDIFDSYSPSKAIAKVKEYEEKKKADEEKQKDDDEIKVGDEVVNTGGYTAIVTLIRDEKCIDTVWCDGSCSNFLPKKSFKKTGRHFDIQNILNQLNDEQ